MWRLQAHPPIIRVLRRVETRMLFKNNAGRVEQDGREAKPLPVVSGWYIDLFV